MRPFALLVALFALAALAIGCPPAKPRAGDNSGSGSAQTEKFRVACEAAFIPMEYFDDNHDIVGFDVDLAKALAKEMGMELEIQHQEWKGIFAGLETGKYDAIMSSVSIKEDRKAKVLFSDAYLNASQIITVHKDTTNVATLDDLRGKRIAVQQNTTGEDTAKTVLGAELKAFGSVQEAFLALEGKMVDAVVNDQPNSTWMVAGRSNLKMVGLPIGAEQYAVAFRKDSAGLCERVNKALASLRADGRLEALKKKWLEKK